MKNIMMVALVGLSFASHAEWNKNCVDKNFNGLDVSFYAENPADETFKILFQTESTAPVGYPGMFENGIGACRDLSVTYLEHKKSGKKYAMYRTQDDYCDGGNTIGLVIDLEKYADEDSPYADAAVGEISDGEFYCIQ